MLLGDLLRGAAMMAALGADDRDVETLGSVPLDDPVELGDERTHEVVDEFDPACGKVGLGVVRKAVEPSAGRSPLPIAATSW